MHATRMRGNDSRNPRSREDRAWKYIERIPIDESRFPTNVKPAAIIIGVRGTNHARLQDESGCCVQLRGKGISSPGTPGAEEPMHLWIKYDSAEQLDKVRAVLEEIIKSCDKGVVAEQRKKPVTPTRPAWMQWPDILPAKPTKVPTKPVDCFYTIHYYIHAVPNVTTSNFEAGYSSFYGFPLEAKFAALGEGNIVKSLLVVPKVVRLEHTVTGTVPLGAHEIIPNAVYYVRPVLPKGMPLSVFHQHLTTSRPPARIASAPPPPPPPMKQGSSLFRGDDLQEFAELYHKPSHDCGGPASASPQALLVQAIHGVLLQHFLRSVKSLAGCDMSILPRLARRWNGMPLALLVDIFREHVGINLTAAQFGHSDFVRMLFDVACPDILDMAWYYENEPTLRVRFGHSGLEPDFGAMDSR